MSFPLLSSSPVHKNSHSFSRPLQQVVPIFWILSGLFGSTARATDLKPEAVAAFDRYIAATETQMDEAARANRFLIVDRLPDIERQNAYDQLHQGQPFIEEMHTEEDHHPIPIPKGLIHHWAGVIFIPKETLAETDAVLRDYDHQEKIYKPDLRQAKLIERNGNESKIFEQFYSKSIITVVLNVYFDVVEKQIGSTRSQSVSRSTRIAEVEDFGTPEEHERADGKDHGYMWRLNSYWRVEEKDGGVYVQTESISLSRTVPVMLAWIINPLTKSIPRDVLLHLLTNTQKAVQASAAASQYRIPRRGR